MEMIWIIVGIAAIALELLTPTALVSIWFAIGALAAWLAQLAGVSFVVQVMICIVVAIVFIAVIRPVAIRYLRGNTVATNADRLIGDMAVVTKQIGADSWGEVKVNGAVWSAVSVDKVVIAVDRKVRIAAIEGAKLLVREINE